jgi:protein TonB
VTALAAKDVSSTRQEILRWTGCALFVLLAHGLAAFAMVPREEEADLDAGSPVALIELAPVPVAPSSTPAELAPGPLAPDAERSARAEAAEKPKPEEPPMPEAAPNPDSTAAVPPAPDKPKMDAAEQQPQEASTAAAPPSVPETAVQAAAPAIGHATRLPSASTLRWQRSLVAHLERSKRYPHQASGQSGVARLAFSIDRQGRLLGSRIVKSSGSALLDAETLALVKRAEPFPAPAPDVADDQLSFVVPIRYASSSRR